MKKIILGLIFISMLSGCGSINPRLQTIDEKDETNIDQVNVVLFEF